jgi:transcriptional regulator with GAF, ATPase, and Fis domain
MPTVPGPSSASDEQPPNDALAFERLLVDLSAAFINVVPDELPARMRTALASLVDLLGFDRSTVLVVDERTGRMPSLVSWARSGIAVFESEDLAREFPWFTERLRLGDPIVLSNLPDELPDAAVAERRHCEEVGLKSILTVPVAVGGALRGVVSFGAMRARRPLPNDLVRRIRLIGDIFANAVARSRSERELLQALAEIRDLKDRLQAENVLLREEVKASHDFEEIVGDSVSLRRVLMQAEQVAPADSSVLITGETGTGKELIARAIHDRSMRRRRPFVAVNCCALPAALVESELFGHEKGAFTGAVNRKIGRFEVADGGTLFLDEIGELAPDLQPKLLRVLQAGEFERVGSARTIKVDVRVIAATNRDLVRAVTEQSFRADLYYRLSVFPIHMPALRERRGDVPHLVWFFITRKQGKLGKRIEKIPRAVMSALSSYPWPGNVRELENVIERALILSSGPTLCLDDSLVSSLAPPAANGGACLSLEAVERVHIVTVLRECAGKINGPGNAAERLGLNPSTLRFRMKKLGIERPNRRNG